jgi:hypothetical protein
VFELEFSYFGEHSGNTSAAMLLPGDKRRPRLRPHDSKLRLGA